MRNKQSNETMGQQQVRELELTCRMWVAAAGVKDARIEELESECNQLRQRVARLSRQIADQRSPIRTATGRRRRTPTMA